MRKVLRNVHNLANSREESGEAQRFSGRSRKRNFTAAGGREPTELGPRQPRTEGRGAHGQAVVVVCDHVTNLTKRAAKPRRGEIFGRGKVPESRHAPVVRMTLAQQDAAAA